MNRKYISTILMALTIFSSIIFTKNILLFNNISSVFKGILILLICIAIYIIYYILFHREYKKLKLFFILSFCVFNFLSSFLLFRIYNYVDSLNKESVTYSISLISLKENGNLTMSEVSNKKIGVVQTDDNAFNESFLSFIDKHNLDNNDNNIVYYDNITSMINDLYDGIIDLSILSSDYKNMLNSIEEFENIENELVLIKDDVVEVKKDDSLINSSNKDFNDSFTVLLMGVDSEKEGIMNGDSNGDSLIVFSFNPKTLNATMLSIPRDSYVPITCFKDKRENKITHASWYGSSCMINTINNFLDISIDYYVKINFKGVVSLVDSIGGVDVDVPTKLCTDDSNRSNNICINSGHQLLNGEQALVLARNRYDLKNGDFDRMNNQQLLLISLMKKMKTVNDINKVMNILNTVSKNMDTNMSVDQILSLYSIFRDIVKASKYNDFPISIQKLQLIGNAQTIYDDVSHINHWNYILNKQSIIDVSNAIKNNLENDNLIKSFSYEDSNNYTPKIVGTGPYKGNNLYILLPNFIGKDKSIVDEFVNKYNINVIYKYVPNNSNNILNNSVISQNYKEKTRIDRISNLEITIIKNDNDNNNDNVNDIKPINKLPNLIGKDINDAKKILNDYGIVDIIVNEIDGILYPGVNNNVVVSQNYPEGTPINDINKIELSIVIY